MKKSLAIALVFLALTPWLALADYSFLSQLLFAQETASIPTAQTIQGLGALNPGTITGMKLYFNCGSSGTAVARIASYTNNTYGAGLVAYTSDTQTLSSGSAIYTFNFSPITINTALFYSIGVNSTTGCSSGKLKGSSDGNSYVDDTTTYKCFSGSCAPVKDIYFEMIAPGDQPDSISITSPVNATSTVDFGLFQGTFNSISTSSPRFVQVNYGYTSSTMTQHDAEPHTLQSGGVNESWVVQKLGQLQTGTIYAQASLYDLAGTGFSATSTIISFTLTTSGNPYFPTVPNSTSTLASSTISCDPSAGNFFTNGICNIIVWAFIPPQSDFDNFSNLKTAIGTKPPFGYFTALDTAFTGLSSSTTSTVSFGNFTGISFFDDLKSFLAWPLWFLFGWWVFNKFRHFKF